MTYLFYLILIIVPLITYNKSVDPFGIKTLLAMVLGFVCLWQYRQPRKYYRPDIAYIFFGWVAISYLLCPWKLGNPGIELLLMISYLGIYVYARDHIFTAKVVPVILVSAVLTLAYNLWPIGIRLSRLEIGPSFVNANIYAGWLVLILPVVFAWAFTGKWLKWLFGGLIFGFGLIALWMTGCRSAMLGLAAAMAAFSAFYWGKRGVIAGALIIGLFGAIWWQIFPHQILDPDRIQFWNGALDMIQSRPWTGYGIGSFQAVYPLFKWPVLTGADPLHLLQNAHNEPFQILAETGIIGLVLFVAMIYWIFKRTDKSDSLVLAIMAGVFGCLIDNFFNVSLRYSAVGLIFWFYLGLLSGQRQKREEPKHEGWLAGISRWSDWCFFN